MITIPNNLVSFEKQPGKATYSISMQHDYNKELLLDKGTTKVKIVKRYTDYQTIIHNSLMKQVVNQFRKINTWPKNNKQTINNVNKQRKLEMNDMYSIVIYNNLYKLGVLSTRSVVSSNPAEDEVYNIMFASFRIGM